MSGPNTNLTQPPMYSSSQNMFSPGASSANQPAGHMKGSPYPPQNSVGSSLMSPASSPQTFSQPGVVPPIAQNYNYPTSPQMPLMDSSVKPPLVNFSKHSPLIPSPKNPTSPYTEKQGFVQNGPITNSLNNSNSEPNLSNSDDFHVNGHNGPSNNLCPPQSMPPASQNQWTSPSQMPPPLGSQNQKLPASSVGGVSPLSHYSGTSQQLNAIDSRPVPIMSQVPSPGTCNFSFPSFIYES